MMHGHGRAILPCLSALEEIAQDVRYGARLLRRSPGFAVVSIIAFVLSGGEARLIAAWLVPLA